MGGRDHDRPDRYKYGIYMTTVKPPVFCPAKLAMCELSGCKIMETKQPLFKEAFCVHRAQSKRNKKAIIANSNRGVLSALFLSISTRSYDCMVDCYQFKLPLICLISLGILRVNVHRVSRIILQMALHN